MSECVSPETIATLKESFYNSKVKITEEEAIRISEEMLGQGQSEKWMQERKKWITASVAGGIIKVRAKTKRKIFCIPNSKAMKPLDMVLKWNKQPEWNI